MKICAVATLVLVIACGGRQTTASKSAAAYRDAQAKGTSVGGGHEHGGHETATSAGDHDHIPGADAHGATHQDTAAGHEAMDHGTSPAKRAMRRHTGTAAHAGHDPQTAQHRSMQHGATQHAAMQHDEKQQQHEHGAAAPPSGAHAQQEPHAGHGTMQTAAAPSMPAHPPASNKEISRTQPATTLRQDQFDAPAPSAVSEARRAHDSKH